jgi:tripartite-type tricarboxylate transporter receptor subunit TctC
MFQQAAGIRLLHVPYRGGGPALTAFIGKQVDITAQAPGPITPHVQSGAARLLASWGPRRSAEYPDVPTFIEFGYKDVEYYIWAGLFAPKGTPAPVIARLRDAMREVMKNPQVTDVFVKAASPPAYMDQPEFQKFVDDDARRLIPVVRKIGRLDESK